MGRSGAAVSVAAVSVAAVASADTDTGQVSGPSDRVHAVSRIRSGNGPGGGGAERSRPAAGAARGSRRDARRRAACPFGGLRHVHSHPLGHTPGCTHGHRHRTVAASCRRCRCGRYAAGSSLGRRRRDAERAATESLPHPRCHHRHRHVRPTRRTGCTRCPTILSPTSSKARGYLVRRALFPSSVGVINAPIQVPLYFTSIDSGAQKVGIYAALGGERRSCSNSTPAARGSTPPMQPPVRISHHGGATL
jgi:hypothetical protein